MSLTELINLLGAAADGNDAPALLEAHGRDHGAQNVERRAHVQVHHAVPGGVVGFVDRAAAGETSGYVHQDVDSLEPGDDGGGQLVGVFGLGEVGRHGSEIG